MQTYKFCHGFRLAKWAESSLPIGKVDICLGPPIYRDQAPIFQNVSKNFEGAQNSAKNILFPRE